MLQTAREKYSILRYSAAATVLTLMAPLASAQLEEVIVTAQKRAERIQDVPMSVSALSGDAIEQKNMLSVTDLQTFVPGLRTPQADVSKTFISIRGVGNRKFDIGASGSVGVFIDEVYLPRFSGADIGLVDLERVEVLKGPQGTIFGRNTAAGAISIWARRPTAVQEGYLELGAGNQDSYLARGALSGALNDKLSARLTLGQQQEGGFQTNTLTGANDDRSSTVGRLGLAYDASDTMAIFASVQHTNREQEALLQKSIAMTSGGGAIFPTLGSPFLQATANDDFRKYPITHDGGVDADSLLASLRIEKDFGRVQLVATTGYQEGDAAITADFDANDADVGRTYFEEHYKNFSQEIRLAGDSWLGGIYYYRDEAYSDYQFRWLNASLPALFAPEVSDNSPIDINTTSLAAFGEYTVSITPALAIIVGGRYSTDEIDFTLAATTSAPGVPPTPFDYSYSDTKRWQSFNPKLSLTYQFADDVLGYATYSEGYKAGGVQFTAAIEPVARQIFDPEELSSYEVGIKSELLNNTLRLNASAFYYDYKDLQVQRVDLTLSGGLPVAFTSNAAKSEIYGFEFDMNWAPLEDLQIGLSYAYLDAQYKDFIAPGGEDFSGNSLPVSPDHTVMSSIDYRVSLDAGWSLSLGTDWIWLSEFNFDADNDPFTLEGNYLLGNAQATLVSPGGHWTLSSFASNLTDEAYYSDMTPRGNEVIAAPAQGRRYGLRVKYSF